MGIPWLGDAGRDSIWDMVVKSMCYGFVIHRFVMFEAEFCSRGVVSGADFDGESCVSV